MPNKMSNGLRRIVSVLPVCAALLLLPAVAWAQPAMPVAFRTWPDQTVSIETYWGLQVSVGPGASELPAIAKPDTSQGGAGLAVRVSGREKTRLQWDEKTSHGEIEVGMLQLDPLSVVLDRAANTAQPSLLKPDDKPTSNAVSIRAWRPDVDDPIVLLPIVLVQADGVNMVYGSPVSLDAAAKDILQAPGVDDGVDVVVMVIHGLESVDAQEVKALATALNATHVYLTGNARLTGDMATRKAVGNTTALVAGTKQGEDGPVLLKQADKPWEAPEAMDAQLTKLEGAARKWAKVYEPLSVNQMNHRPSNGTHTPRWNIEHMASRQMFFLTSLYHAADASFPHIKLDPKQMPPDYKARHPDWDGAEEARRVYRTCAFVRRFAYLFHDQNLDQPPVGGRIRFNAIVPQLTRHYPEHTRNVLDKMELDDWPKQ